MKNIEKLFVILFLLGFQTGLIGQSIDSNASKISFDVKNMFSTVEGSLDGLSGTITFDETNLAATIFDVCLPANSIDTNNDKRDGHLMAEDYFNEAQYEDICFEATKVEKSSNAFLVKGDLTMNGVSKSVEFPFTYANNKFQGQLIVDRYDFGIGGSGGFMIGRDVTVNIVAIIE